MVQSVFACPKGNECKDEGQIALEKCTGNNKAKKARWMIVRGVQNKHYLVQCYKGKKTMILETKQNSQSLR